MICSSARFDLSEQDITSPDFKYMNAPVIGDASETALVKFYQPIEDVITTRSQFPFGKCEDNSDSKLPFNSVNKYALSIVRQEGADHHWVVHMKGAPEKMWQFCSKLLYHGSVKSLDSSFVKEF